MQLSKALALCTLVASAFAGVIPPRDADVEGHPTVSRTTRPVVLTATRIYHTLVPTSPWIVDRTTTIVWTQYDVPTPTPAA